MIQQEQYKIFFESITTELEGDWVIVGGSLLALINATPRATTDIDLCSIDELTNEKRISLMRLADLAGLSIESINPAADFFLKQIPNWKSALILLQSGKRGNLYRPSLELYLKLKLNRCTPTDVSDCMYFIEWHKKNNIFFEIQKIKDLILNYGSKNTEALKIISIL